MANLKILVYCDRFDDNEQHFVIYLPLPFLHIYDNVTELQYYWESFYISTLGIVAGEWNFWEYHIGGTSSGIYRFWLESSLCQQLYMIFPFVYCPCYA
jgi:hypothetical protein